MVRKCHKHFIGALITLTVARWRKVNLNIYLPKAHSVPRQTAVMELLCENI